VNAKETTHGLKVLIANEWGMNTDYLTETSFVIRDDVTGELFIVEVSQAEIVKREG
jgi:hypothetical protein